MTRPFKRALSRCSGSSDSKAAAVTIRGIELAEKIKKHQFNLKPLTGKETTAPETWTAVLAA
jgi:hypothetical protein